MCKSWVQFGYNLLSEYVFIHLNINSAYVVGYNYESYTKLISFLYIVYTKAVARVFNLLKSSLCTLYTGLIITRAYLSNSFFIINNMGVKL